MVLVVTIVYLLLSCFVAILCTMSKRGMAIIAMSIIYGLIILVLLMAPREDEPGSVDGSVVDRTDEVSLAPRCFFLSFVSKLEFIPLVLCSASGVIFEHFFGLWHRNNSNIISSSPIFTSKFTHTNICDNPYR